MYPLAGLAAFTAEFHVWSIAISASVILKYPWSIYSDVEPTGSSHVTST